MSKYTTELRFICERAAGLSESAGYAKVNEIIQKAIPEIFDFDFPIFDESYRNVLCTKILRHYYTQEICCETVGRWKLFLEDKLSRIMPYYNKLYLSDRFEFDPLRDVDITTEHHGEGNSLNQSNEAGESNSTNTETKALTDTAHEQTTYADMMDHTGTISDAGTNANTGKNVNRFSATPQGGLDGIEHNTYLTDARIIDETNNGTSSNLRTLNHQDAHTGNDQTDRTINYTGTDTHEGESSYSKDGSTTNTSTDEYINHTYGKTAGKTYASMITEYRKTLMNIDDKVIAELSDLFMRIW